MHTVAAYWGGLARSVADLVQVCPVLLTGGSWGREAALMALVGLGGWAVWRWRTRIGRAIGLEREITEKMVVADPHGFHMRRCKNLVLVARKYVSYGIYVRHHSAGGKTWAHARSMISLLSLGVRGPRKGESPPVVEVKVHGFRPRKVLLEIRATLEEDAHKYLNVYELAELAKQTGGKIVVRPVDHKRVSLGQRITQMRNHLGSWAARSSPEPRNCRSTGVEESAAEEAASEPPAPNRNER